MVLDDGLDNIELSIVRVAGVRDSIILEEKVLCLLTLMDEKSHVTHIINNQVRSVTLNIILRIYQGIQDAAPVILKALTLTGKHRSIFVMRNERHSVIMGREIFARAPMEVTAKGLDSLKKHGLMDGHAERFNNTGTNRHLKYLLC